MPILLMITALLLTAHVRAGEILVNGIELPAAWPPRIERLSRTPAPPPAYLQKPPSLIPIDVGRQLFVDDFLIESTDLRRSFHRPELHPGNPVIRPDREWEQGLGPRPGSKMAAVFSDGVWYDPRDRLFKMWYMCGYQAATCYATSPDGLAWTKPLLDIVPGTNIVLKERRDSTAVVLDLHETDPARRFKYFRSVGEGSPVFLRFSPDGIHWGELAAKGEGGLGGRHSVFFNPFREVWVFGIRDTYGADGRVRRYGEHIDVAAGARARVRDFGFWVGADEADACVAPAAGSPCPQLYNLDAMPYESLIVGLFAIWRGVFPGRPKINELTVGYSRDGFSWHRPDRQAFIGVNPERASWQHGNVQSAGGVGLVVRDRLYIYYSGRTPSPESPRDEIASTGLAFLRRDGFASMDAAAARGSLTTRRVKFSGRRLFVNAAVEGELTAEVLDEDGRPLAPFTRQRAIPWRGDATLAELRWKGAADLSALAGKPVRFRFHLRKGRVYAFWVSPDARGASHGYVAAGGPGFAGPADDQGSSVYR